jgi:uncharacterized sodium:solute symporter family permease YidK
VQLSRFSAWLKGLDPVRVVPVVLLVVVGLFFILARDFCARFMMSLDYQVPAIKNRERPILRSLAVMSMCFGVGVLILSVLMALNVVFPW